MPVDDLFAVPGVDELFELDPSGFVSARNDLAKELRARGERDVADGVKKLPRPTVVAWAVNQVARRDPPKVDDLLHLTARVTEAQAAALGEAGPGELRDAVTARRSAVRELAAAAAELAGANHTDEAAATIEAASLDDDLRHDLCAGRLTKTLDPPSGFGFQGMPDVPAKASRERPDRGEVERLQRELERAEAATEEAQRQRRRAEDGVADAERALDDARTRLTHAQQEQERAAAALAEAQ